MKKRLKWEFYLDKKKEHRWKAIDKNGNILFISAEGYKNKEDAEQCAKRAGWGVRKDAENTTHSTVAPKEKKKCFFETVKSWFKKTPKPTKKPPQYGSKDGFQ